MDEKSQIMPNNPEFIVMSQEAKRFKSSLFGKFLLDKAAIEAGHAAKELCTVDPDDKTQIIQLQNDARRLSDMMSWINEAIQVGNHEYAEYQQKVNEGEI